MAVWSCTRAGRRITYRIVCPMLYTLVCGAGIEPRSARCKPAIRGLRHTFAVNTLISWYGDGLDVDARLPVQVHLDGSCRRDD
jgi:hypothetical protein